MIYWVIDLLKILGALGFFLYGMKLMSESLQRVAGDRMKTILAAMTSNKFRGVLTGFLITAIIQSSSATTVMLVSFVNAGLLTLTESIGVVMGTNIGTTVTAWLISILGFKVKVAHMVLPLIGLSLPLLFSKNKNKSNWGSVIIGFAIIFIGLDFLQASAPDISNNPGMLEFLTKYSNHGYLSVLIFLAIGMGLTMIIQSSSATMALTLVMCYNGWIAFDMAAAMVLGQNIGTTITANLAALVANTSAKRTAMAHLLFNVVGVILVLIVFYPFLDMVEWVILKVGLTSPFPQIGQSAEITAQAMPIGLSIFHTIFNLLNTIVMIGFVSYMVKIVSYLVKEKDSEEDFKLKYINIGLLSTVDLSIVQAQKEINIYAKRLTKMFSLTNDLIWIKSGKKYHKLLDKIKKYEEASNTIEVEISSYLTQINAETFSVASTEDINLMLSLVSDFENIGDSCDAIAQVVNRKRDGNTEFTLDMDKNLDSLLNIVSKMLSEMMQGYDEQEGIIDTNKMNTLHAKLKKTSQKFRTEHYKNLRKGAYKVKPGIIYSDLCAEIVKLADNIFYLTHLSIQSKD